MFDATFSNVVAALDRTVNSDGRIPRLSDYKGRRVTVVITDDSAPTIDATMTCGGCDSRQCGLTDVVVSE